MLAIKTEERQDGATPKGGVYSIAYFQDDQGIPVAKEDATKIEIIEFDKNDRQIWRTYMTKEPYQARKNSDNVIGD
jgi:hypothetical protein